MFLLALLLLGCTTDRTRRGYLENAAATYDTPPARPVIIVPGFGVTRLYDPTTKRFVWGTGRNTMVTKYADDLDLPIGDDASLGHDRLVPRGFTGSRGPINIGWHLREALRRYGGYTPERDVFIFEYDWRLSARDNAAQLGALVDRVSHGAKVDLVTHSAGSIVALTYVKLGGGASHVEHLVMLAPTQRGVIDAFRVLVQPEVFLRRVFRPDIVATWPFITELLPENGRFLFNDERDFWRAESWRELLVLDDAHRRAFERSLANARQFRDELRDTPMPESVRVNVLAGDCVPTARSAMRRADGSYVFYVRDLRDSEQSLAKTLFEAGDGTVPLSSASNGGDAMLFCDGHQGLATDPNVHRALLRLLRD